MIGGVAGGLAEYFGWIRNHASYLVGAAFYWDWIFAYIAALIIIPKPPTRSPSLGSLGTAIPGMPVPQNNC